MDVISALAAIVEATCDRWLAPGSPYSAYSYVGAIMVIAAIFVARRRRSGIPTTRFWRSAFPTRIWGHPSTRLDAWMYVWNFMLLSTAYGSVAITSAFWSEHTHASLQMVAGSPWFPNAPISLILIVTAIAEVLLVDFGYWIAHYYMHRTEALWEFHKVHHSAEVMTPLTEMRQHPIEMILFPNVIALMIGLGYAVLKQLFGAAQPLTLMNVNVFLLIFFVTYSHLRHSHVWLPFTGWIGHVLHSPAHHQIHHSTQPKHHGRNLGLCLSLYDWAFGTLWMPAQREHVEFGIGPEQDDFATLQQSFTLPFVKAAGHLRRAAVNLRPAAPRPGMTIDGKPSPTAQIHG